MVGRSMVIVKVMMPQHSPLTPVSAWVSFPVMKAAFLALLAVLLFVGGCGKNEVKRTAKESPKSKEPPEKPKPKPPPITPGTVLGGF